MVTQKRKLRPLSPERHPRDPSVTLDDVIFSLQKHGGITTYWRALSDGLLQNPSLKVQHRLPARPAVVSRYLPAFSVYTDIFHSSYYRTAFGSKVTNVVTVYDFTYEKFRTGAPRFVHSMQKRTAIQNASGIICISQNTADDLLSYYGPLLDGKSVTVIHLGVKQQDTPPYIPPAPSSGKTLLYVGPRGGYKNFAALTSVWPQLRAEFPSLRMLCVGGEKPTPSETLPGIEYLGPISDESLIENYRNAAVFVSASRYEGFGLPILEAMSWGCPVLCSDIKAYREVAGDSAWYFFDSDHQSLLHQLRRLLTEGVPQRQIEAAFARHRNFTWENTVNKTVSFYKSLVSAGEAV